ncbi:MAG TPA: mechanosensitive ion channel family protein [Candidatus Acetothermia bacterium]|nr:mechanosensitive ion channel family protein [Candidatus Acetothermia bacterium]
MGAVNDFLGLDIAGNPLWKYFLLLGILAGAVVVHRVLAWAVRHLLRRRKAPAGVEESLTALAGKPLGALIYLLGLRVGLQFFALSAETWAVLRGFFVFAATFVAIYLVTKLVDVVFSLWKERAQKTKTKFDDQIIPILSRILKLFVWAIGVLLILQNLGYNITSLLAGLGIGGLAIALAAQETLSNFIGALALLVDRPCEVGDRVDVEDISGTVEAIGLRSTRIRTLDGTVVAIPNRKLADAKINNFVYRPSIKNQYTIGITYDTPYEKIQEALAILREILGNHPSTAKYWVYFKEFGPYSLNILVIHWCKYTDYQKFLEATEEINLEIRRRFEEAGISFAFPTQTVEVRGAFPPMPES